jgi:type I restriction enzyme S subunit
MRDGWVETTLGEISALQMGRTPSRRESSYWTEDLTYPFCTIADMDSKYVEPKREGVTKSAIEDGKAKVARKGTLLMSFKLTIGRMGFAARDIFPNEAIVMIEADESKVLNHFLYLRLASMDLTEGSGRAVKGSTLNSASIASISFLVPPLPEQKRIVDLISSVDTYIEALQQQLESAKRSRNAVLHEMLTVGGDGWVEATLGDVADVIDPHPSHRAPAVDDAGIPFIGIGDLRRTGDIDFAKARRVSKEILEEHKARYDRSDFLIGLGRVASIGMVVRLPNEKVDYAVSPTLAVIRAKEMLGQFLFYLLEGPQSQEQFQRFKKGSTRESVGMQVLRKIKVHVPPLTEQHRIVEIISSMDKVVDQTQLTISEAKNIRSGLLTDLLSGENEIPASYDKVMGAA